MNRTLKEATVQRYHYQTTAELNEHLQAFLLAYNHAKRLKTLRGLTPHGFVCTQWQKDPVIFTRDPTHRTLGLYSDGNTEPSCHLVNPGPWFAASGHHAFPQINRIRFHLEKYINFCTRTWKLL